MNTLHSNIIENVANQTTTMVVNAGRVYIGQVDVTEELNAIIRETAKVCVEQVDCINNDTNSEWDHGVREAKRQIKTAFDL